MSFEIHQSFMVGYVRRINLATFNVVIGGVRIGEARYTRLAQINLKSRIITFSRFAIENVPERGRRYLVIHELAHVKETDHSPRFWQLVAEHEPHYKEIGRELDTAFHRNVRADKERQSKLIHQTGSGIRTLPGLLSSAALASLQAGSEFDSAAFNDQDDCPVSGASGCFDGSDDEFGAWTDAHQGIVCGGDEIDC